MKTGATTMWCLSEVCQGKKLKSEGGAAKHDIEKMIGKIVGVAV